MTVPFQRKKAHPVSLLKATLPTTPIPDGTDHVAVAREYIEKLDNFNADLFTEDANWRDLWALCGINRSFHGNKRIGAAWAEASSGRIVRNFTIIPQSAEILKLGESDQYTWIRSRFTFETMGKAPIINGSGFIGLTPDTTPGNRSGWKIWYLSTILELIKGYPSPDVLDGPRIPPSNEFSRASHHISNGISNGVTNGVTNGLSNGIANGVNGHSSAEYYDAVILGAGMGGLSTAGRLQALGVSYLAIEKNDHVGDTWMNRYDSAKLHTPRAYSQFPFERVYPPEDPYYLSKYDLARGFQRFVHKHGINVRVSSVVESGTRDEKKGLWCLQVRTKGNPDLNTIYTRHVIFSTGAGGQTAKRVEVPGRKIYKGTAIHSVDFQEAWDFKGKKGLVIGSANTAHDVASDMLEAKLSSVTMVQRDKTAVIPVEYITNGMDRIYNETFSIEAADRYHMSSPIAVSRAIVQTSMLAWAAKEPERFDALDRVGFRVHRDVDITSISFEKRGTHYLDVGDSEKISKGLIKMKSGVTATRFTETGLEFSDGSHLEADLIVFCIGFEANFRQQATDIFGEKVGDYLEDYWSLDKEGEPRGAFRPMHVPGIWYHGGDFGAARYYSRFIAMQIKADVSGTPFVPYLDTPLEDA